MHTNLHCNGQGFSIRSAMVISCPNCSTKFKIADEKILPGGIKVRCSKCQNIFRVDAFAAPAPAAEPAAEARSDSNDINLDFDIGSDAPAVAAAPSLPPLPPPVSAPPPAANFSSDLSAGQFTDDGIELVNSKADLEVPSLPLRPPPVSGPPKAAPPQPPWQTTSSNLTSDDVLDFPSTTTKTKSPPSAAPAAPNLDFGTDKDPLQTLESAVDDGLSSLLSGASSNASDPLASLPLTSPDNIDLATLARQDKDPAASRTFTDDGIELIGSPAKTPAAAPAPTASAPKAAPKRSAAPAGDHLHAAKTSIALPEPPPEKPRKISWGLLVGILVGLGAIGLAAVNFSSIARWAQSFNHPPQPVRATGSDSIVIDNIASSLVRNVDNRAILLIYGQARNTFQTPRSLIRVKASIFSPSGSAVAEKEVWAGNQFERDEIFQFTDQASIDKAYSSTGRSLSNLNVPAGASVPFQILIFDPPKDWNDFTVVASASQPAAGP